MNMTGSTYPVTQGSEENHELEPFGTRFESGTHENGCQEELREECWAALGICATS